MNANSSIPSLSIQNQVGYEICQVPNYKINYSKSKKMSGSIQQIDDILKTDLQFHERLGKNDDLKLAIDVDKLTLHNQIENLQNIMNNICDFIKVDISDISYTTNFSVESGSHHIVIPKFCMKSSTQKIM